MNLQVLAVLTFVFLTQAGTERRAGNLAIDPLPTSPPSTGPTVPPIEPTPTSNTSELPSTTNTPTSGSTSGTSDSESSTASPSGTVTPSSTQAVATSLNPSQSSISQQQSTDIITVTPSGLSTTTSSSSSPSSTASANDGASGNGDTPVSVGTIVGLSVAGGIAVLGAVAFVIWKFTRKRFSEFDADGEEIKWPELGHESHALPTRPTGRVGVDDDGYDEAGVDGAGRQLGKYAPSSTTGETSMTDLHSYGDPYAVPPLPHLDPNQPYHDDPSSYGAHYDPYQGPVPLSFHDPSNVDRMSSRSPAPMNYYGRQSPGPSLSYQ